MSYKSVYTLSEIRYLWKSRGSKNYEMKCLNAEGNFIQSITFEDVRNHREVSGKLVTSPREGEAYHWPRLQHENLTPLLDIVSINENVSIYITPISRRSLNYVIHEDGFLEAPICFDRKKSYAEDILWGLDYIHDKHLSLMNLSEDNIYINESDKAVITEFSHLMLSERATKNDVYVSALYRAPELDINTFLSENFDAIKAEIWACGVLMLQIFTGNILPTTFIPDDGKLLEFKENMHHDVLVKGNVGAYIAPNTVAEFKEFLGQFLCFRPSNRTTAKTAAINPFLQRNPREHDKYFEMRSELHSTITDEISRQLSFIDNASTSSKSSLQIANKKSEDISMFTSVNGATMNKARLKKRWPFNKFINLHYVSSSESESINWFANLSCSRKSTRNGQLFEKSETSTTFPLEIGTCVTLHANMNTENNPQRVRFTKDNTAGSYSFATDIKERFDSTVSDTINKSIDNVETKKEISLETFTNISVEHNSLQKTENSTSVKDGIIHIDDSLSDPNGGTSNDPIPCNKYQTIYLTKHSNENIHRNVIKMKKETKDKTALINANIRALQPNELERNTANNMVKNKPNSYVHPTKLLHIFPSRSYPYLCSNSVRSSFGYKTTTRRSVSSGDVQLINSAEDGVSKDLIFGAENTKQDHNSCGSISVWNHSYNPNCEASAGEGDKGNFQWSKIPKDGTDVPLENKILGTYFPDSMKLLQAGKGGAKNLTQEVKDTPENELLSSDKIKVDIDRRSNSNCFNNFNVCNTDVLERPIEESNILIKNEVPSCSCTTIPDEISSQENISIETLHANTNTDNIDCPRDSKLDNLSKAAFTENNPQRVRLTKDHTVGGYLFATDIKERSDSTESDTINKSIDNVDFCGPKRKDRQQMDLLNPFLNECEWNVETSQANVIELTNLNSSEKGFEQDDEITSNNVSVIHDQISVFERNLNSFTEIPLSPKYCDAIVGSLVKKEKKRRKMSWYRHLCPGCKVYREYK